MSHVSAVGLLASSSTESDTDLCNINNLAKRSGVKSVPV